MRFSPSPQPPPSQPSTILPLLLLSKPPPFTATLWWPSLAPKDGTPIIQSRYVAASATGLLAPLVLSRTQKLAFASLLYFAKLWWPSLARKDGTPITLWTSAVASAM